MGGCGWVQLGQENRELSEQRAGGGLGALELGALTLPLFTTQPKERLVCSSPWL